MRRSLNRTFMVLKVLFARLLDGAGVGLNRTVVVLKGILVKPVLQTTEGLNRTVVVLKVLGRVARDGADLARIVPLWR
jgi:hypothetical protein